MAKPQLENGHARIANELLEALSRFSPGRGEAQILWAIIRKTYGWNKKRDFMSIGQIAELTGLTRRWVIVCVSNLEAKKMIKVYRQRGRGSNGPNQIEIQKNYDLWVVKEKSDYYRNSLKNRKLRYRNSQAGVVKETQSSEGKGQKVVKEIKKGSEGCIHPQKTITTKDNRSSVKSCESTNGELFDRFWSEYPRKVGKKKCRHIWNRLKPSAELSEKIISAVKAYKRTEQWQKNKGQFIPHPATWLNQERWNDEISASPEPKRGDPDWLPTEQEAEDIMRVEFGNE